jgi:hypothetical protein
MKKLFLFFIAYFYSAVILSNEEYNKCMREFKAIRQLSPHELKKLRERSAQGVQKTLTDLSENNFEIYAFVFQSNSNEVENCLHKIAKIVSQYTYKFDSFDELYLYVQSKKEYQSFLARFPAVNNPENLAQLSSQLKSLYKSLKDETK